VAEQLTVWMQNGVGDTRGDEMLLGSTFPVENVALVGPITAANVVEEVPGVTAAC